MPGDVKSEQLFLIRHLFVLGPRKHPLESRLRGRWGHFVEQRDLPAGPVLVRFGRGREGLVDASEQPGALPAEKIERATFHQTLQDLAIGDAGIESPAEIFQ